MECNGVWRLIKVMKEEKEPLFLAESVGGWSHTQAENIGRGTSLDWELN